MRLRVYEYDTLDARNTGKLRRNQRDLPCPIIKKKLLRKVGLLMGWPGPIGLKTRLGLACPSG